MGSSCKTIVWFRKDLRIEDNPALAAAARDGQVLPVYIWCPTEEGQFYPGRVSRWWLKQSLAHLNKSLKSLGSALVLIKAESTLTALLQCVNAVGATKVVYNHLYDPISLVRDHNVKKKLVEQGICVQSFKGDLLYEPWEVYDERGHAFTTFNAFWNKCLSMSIEPASVFPPWRLNSPAGMVESCSIEDLGFENELEKSSNALLGRGWSPGWSNADKALAEFVDHHLIDYSKNSVKLEGTTSSFLSPYLHFGELSVRKVFQCIRMKQILWAKEGNSAGEENVNLFLRALGLREYSRYLCFNFPFTHERSLMSNLRFYPWRSDHAHFKAWRQGRTGYPLVDAGMRELWATGWMHNRIRVIASSFFVKFLLLPWTWGMKYFWDTLLDADLESDILGWQYISGSLPDGHELDRLDSPQVQGCKFDPEGEYVRCWLPELARMPTEWIHHPWDAPSHLLKAAGVDLGLNYPKPIVDIDLARERLADALTIMWESEAAARAANANGTEEVVMDNLDEAETWGIPIVVLKENATPNISSSSDQRVPSSSDQRVPSLQNYNMGSSLRKRSIDWKEEKASCNNLQKEDCEPESSRTDEDWHSTAESTSESTSSKKRNSGGELVMPPPLSSSLKAKPVSECESPDLSQPWEKEIGKEKASSKEGECA